MKRQERQLWPTSHRVLTPCGLCVATLRELAPAIADACTHAPAPCIDGEVLSALSLALSLTLCPLPLALQRACLSTVMPWPQQARPAAPSSCRYHRPGYGQTQSTACSDPTAHRRCCLCPAEPTVRCRPFSTVAGAGGLEPLLLVVRPLQAASVRAAPHCAPPLVRTGPVLP